MKKSEYIQKNKAFLEEKSHEEGIGKLSQGVLYEVITSGESTKAVGPRSIVTCHYKGSLINGSVFDNSYERNCPEAFRVSDLIPGFQIALQAMHIGDHWRVFIPSEAGYGPRGAGRDIPGGSTLIFEIELIAIT